jgi:AcrR family transcriptional regulator
MSSINNSRRTRRTREEVQDLMLDAAREMFSIKGFDATTREIAERATVTEQLLFNHFDSKQQLFAAAVMRPFEALVDQQLTAWADLEAAGTTSNRMMRAYVEGLWRLVHENGALFRALSADPFGSHVTPILDRLEQLTTKVAERRQYSIDPHIAVRIVFAAVTHLALHSEASNRDASHIIDELTKTLSAGLTRRG